MIKILVLGQTPPPYGGQAAMIGKLLNGRYDNIKFYHVRMAFSEEMDDMGKIQISKIFHLFAIITKTIFYRFRYNIKILYYPPSGPDKIPMYRDIIILVTARWIFQKTIFHFHASGISEMLPKLSLIPKILYKWSYFEPDIAIRVSEFNPEDAKLLRAKKEFVIPNGIEDNYLLANNYLKKSKICNILFVGLVRESKGVLILLEAAQKLKEKGLKFKCSIMGKVVSKEFQELLLSYVKNYGLESFIELTGVLTGIDKYNRFAQSDIFCFPTFFESESFGLAVLEAMQFSLPVVATKWRGVQSLVENGVSGYLVSIKDSQPITEKLEVLIKNPDIRKRMGRNGRELYLQKYTIKKFYENMEKCFYLL